MNSLIKVTNENGKQLVSAKELYIGLGLSKSKWSRWYRNNIVENEFFKENVDWAGVRLDVEGNETMDFAITLDFAKHIAMMARTEKSHLYRNYFIECEKQVQQMPQLIPTGVQAIKLVNQQVGMLVGEVESIQNRVSDLEDTMTIDFGQQQELQNIAKSKAISAIGGKESPAYRDKGLRTKVFSSIWKDFKDYFQINSYRNTPRKDLDKAKDYLKSWKVQGKLLREIEDCNNQIGFEEVC